MNMLMLYGLGLIAFSIGSIMIELSEFTKIKDVASGLTIYKKKSTGERYVRCGKSGYLMKIDD